MAGFEALIPDNVALGTAECLARCGIDRGEQPTDQRQPRVPANAFPAGITTAYPAGATAGSAAEVSQGSEEATSTYYSSSAATYTTTYASEATEAAPSSSAAASSSYYSSSASAYTSTYSSRATEAASSSSAPASSTYSSVAEAAETTLTSTYYSSAPAATATSTSESGSASCEGDDCASASPSAPYYPPSEGDNGVTIIIEENGPEGQGPVTVNVYENDANETEYAAPAEYSDSTSWSIKKARRQAGYRFGAEARSM